MQKQNVGIVDDHLLFAEGIGNIVGEMPFLTLAFITNSVDEMYKQLELHSIQVLLLDVNLKAYNGIEIMESLQKENRDLKYMIISMYQPSDLNIQLNHFKGDAYVLKVSGKDIFQEALLSIRNNIQYFDPNIKPIKAIEDNFTNNLKLTKREKEIISLIAIGKTTKEIAALLFLSELTIKTHRKNISEKLGTKGLADLLSKTIT